MPAWRWRLNTTRVASSSACSLGSAASQSGTGYEPTVVVRMRGRFIKRTAQCWGSSSVLIRSGYSITHSVRVEQERTETTKIREFLSPFPPFSAVKFQLLHMAVPFDRFDGLLERRLIHWHQVTGVGKTAAPHVRGVFSKRRGALV